MQRSPNNVAKSKADKESCCVTGKIVLLTPVATLAVQLQPPGFTSENIFHPNGLVFRRRKLKLRR